MKASEFARRAGRIAHGSKWERETAGRQRVALRALIKRSGARPIVSRRQVVAWRMPDNSVACVWKRFRSMVAALDELDAIHATAIHADIPARVYPCGLCGGWHLAR